jgi:hypothetical protein
VTGSPPTTLEGINLLKEYPLLLKGCRLYKFSLEKAKPKYSMKLSDRKMQITYNIKMANHKLLQNNRKNYWKNHEPTT